MSGTSRTTVIDTIPSVRRVRSFMRGCPPYTCILACREPAPPIQESMKPPYVRIAELSPYAGQTVRVRGWVTHVRSSGKVAFVVMRDGSGVLQCVLVKSSIPAEAWERFAELTQETTIEVTGEVRPDKRAPGGVELGLNDLVITGPSPIDYPIQPKEHGIDFLLDHRHFWLRSSRHRAIARVRPDIE